MKGEEGIEISLIFSTYNNHFNSKKHVNFVFLYELLTTVLQKNTCEPLSLASENRINALEIMQDIFI